MFPFSPHEALLQLPEKSLIYSIQRRDVIGASIIDLFKFSDDLPDDPSTLWKWWSSAVMPHRARRSMYSDTDGERYRYARWSVNKKNLLKIEDKQGNEDDGLKGDEGKLDEEELDNITSFGQASSVRWLGTKKIGFALTIYYP